MAVFSWRVSILQRPHLGEVQPDRWGSSDRQFPSNPASRSNAGRTRSRGPNRPVAIQACEGPKILWQVIGTAEFPSLA